MDSFSGLLNNAALMLILCVIYDTFNIHAISKKYVREGITGLIVGLIALTVMLNPWVIQPGVFFDTRWVLLSLCGLFFGFTPTVIAMIIAGSFRLYQGGPGGTVGTIVIVSTACTGLGWRYWQRKFMHSLGWKQLYAFGFLVQLVMLLCMLLMPETMRIPIIKAVAPPILLIYPVLTMILGLILKRQEQRRATDKALIKEVNERKTAEISARKSKEEWENTFNSITDIVSLQDKNFRILKINQAGCDALGLESKDIIGRHCYHFFSDLDDPCPLCPLGETVNTLEPHVHEIFNETLGKTFLVSAAPVLDENGTLTHLTHIARDITDKKKLEEDLFQAQKMESIGTLAGGIAHDFNNILSIIMGYAELAKDHIPQDSEAQSDIDQIFKSSQRAADLVQHILMFSRKSDHSLEPLFPHLIVKEALKMLRASLPSTIHIQEDIDKNCGTIMADPTNIHQIIINLCTNALHSMENEKGTLSIRLYRKTLNKNQIAAELGESPGMFVALEIKDTGHGMDQGVMGNIFDPYFTTKEVGKGTGLGLSVIHGIVKDYHGFIRVESTPGTGSMFQVYLPALTAEASANKISADTQDALPTGTEHILIVDDESSIVAVNQKFLGPGKNSFCPG
jgi:PAS domain S-box-containing protein